MRTPTVRRGRKSDSVEFLKLLGKLAEFEHLEPPSEEGKKRIMNDIFEDRKLGLFVAPVGRRLVGYALYFYSYSSFLAKPTLYLEDIFVLEQNRRKGIGLALFRACAREAVRERCGRLEWAVLRWNKKAIRFYENLGARRLDDWAHYRLTAEEAKRVYGFHAKPGSQGEKGPQFQVRKAKLRSLVGHHL